MRKNFGSAFNRSKSLSPGGRGIWGEGANPLHRTLRCMSLPPLSPALSPTGGERGRLQLLEGPDPP